MNVFLAMSEPATLKAGGDPARRGGKEVVPLKRGKREGNIPGAPVLGREPVNPPL
jgi:hypothetical protein